MIRLIATAVALAALNACGALAADVGVTINTFQFSPNPIAAAVGDQVLVTNEDGTQHSLTADEGGLFDTGLLGRGEQGSFAAPAAGTYTFHCQRHPSMQGTLTVQ
jgi:plastocyanin